MLYVHYKFLQSKCQRARAKMALTYSAGICNFSKLSIDESAFSADNIIYKKHGFQVGFCDCKRAEVKRR